MLVVNFTVGFSHKEKHYLGVAQSDGVLFELIDAPCGSARQLLSFTNCADAPQGIFWDGVTGIDASSGPAQGYLVLVPDAL